MKGFKVFQKIELTAQQAEITRLVSKQVAKITGKNIKRLDGFMRCVIHEIATDTNAYEFAYEIMAQVAIKRYEKMVRDEEEFARGFTTSISNYWKQQLAKADLPEF
jgi:hypothetical protein